MYQILLLDHDSNLNEKILNAVDDAKFYIKTIANENDFFQKLSESENEENYDLFIIVNSNHFNLDEMFNRITKDYFMKNIPFIILDDNSEKNNHKIFNRSIMDVFPKDIEAKFLLNYIENILEMKDKISHYIKIKSIIITDSESKKQNYIATFDSFPFYKKDYFESDKSYFKDFDFGDFLFIDIDDEENREKTIIKIKKKHEEAKIFLLKNITDKSSATKFYLNGLDDVITLPCSTEKFYKIMSIYAENINLENLNRKFKDKIERISITDPLTGLHNHNYIFETLNHEINRQKRYKNPLSLIILDIDNFRTINDTLGHQQGNEVLIEVTKIINEIIRKADIVGRYSDEEFLIILPETQLKDALHVAERIRVDIEKKYWDSENLIITISGGVIQFLEEDTVELLKKAEELLYQAKLKGQNRIESINLIR